MVTIAFSSPVVSAINYQHEPSLSDVELDDEDDLPLDDSEVAISPVSTAKESSPPSNTGEEPSSRPKQNKGKRYEQYRAMKFNPRPVSRIDEHDEEAIDGEMSLVHVDQNVAVTPAPQRALTKRQRNVNKGSSILCLTPLSDFSLHQVDRARHPEESYVEERPHPGALRQAHGSMALAIDELVKAITDAEPTELYWEQLHRLHIGEKNLSSLHGLKDYCSTLEELSIGANQITQLAGLPSSLRTLDIPLNALTDLTSFGHLRNLQYVDISSNHLESLEAFSSLVHLRSLNASNNRIRNIDGILDLNGLLELRLSHNELSTVDFEGAELSRLQALDLSHNHLHAVDNLHWLSGLEELDLSYNRLQQLSTNPQGRHLALKTLRISHNDLESMDLSDLPNIKALDLDSNAIREIRQLSSAYHLEILSMRGQSASSDIVNAILSTPNECRKICLSSNMVPQGIIKMPDLPQCNLRELEIAACGIAELPSDFGDRFPNCRLMNLNFNAIQDVAPLEGMRKLTQLLLAKNRIKRLRRTCILLSRLRYLAKVDVRDNPLTVGFYSPLQEDRSSKMATPEERYLLPERSAREDDNWMTVLDEVTSLRRRTMYLLLAEQCECLLELDGVAFQRKLVLKPDQLWQKLTDRGVLLKPPPTAAGMERQDAEGESLPSDADDFVNVEAVPEMEMVMVE